MRVYSIYTKINKKLLFQGRYPNFRVCVEEALKLDINLNGADLSKQDLSNITVDGHNLDGCDFSFSNLTGANMSEGSYKNASFKNSSLFNTCFAYSKLNDAEFLNAEFGATDVSQADLSGCLFNTPECFRLSFMQTSNQQECKYLDSNGKLHVFSHPPIVISGLSPVPVIYLNGVSACINPNDIGKDDIEKMLLNITWGRMENLIKTLTFSAT